MTSFLEGQAQTGSRGNPPREYSTAFRRVTVAELLAIGASPVELIPAPGPGKVVVPVSMIAKGAGGAGFTGPGNISTMFANDPNRTQYFSSFDAVTGYAGPFLALYLPADGRDLIENSPFVLTTMNGDEMADGDYDIDVLVEYSILEL